MGAAWAGLALVAVAGYAVFIEPYWIQASEYQVTIPGLAPEFDGFSLIHLSDLHGRVDVFSHPRFLAWQKACHALAITGDLYSPTRPRRRLVAHLERLAAPEGVFYVSGNHDYRKGRLQVGPWQPGVHLLDNRVVVLRRGRAHLILAGIPDLVKGQPAWDQVRQQLDSWRSPVILLSHRPDAWNLPGIERVQLILAGHTHGGQVALPFWGAPIRHNHVPDRYVAGLKTAPGKPVLITSRGLGTSELPIRFLARPEMIRVILRAPGQERGTL
ncbi:MAG: metallophosphoesterase [Sulfobacillus sp.]|nr:metallophosphoesterase [Sulfobacillus sp.]